ncbi:MarR family transcriptional regulator [Herbiconiux sp. CPCC 203407]|uniref:MarR family transcriptional regulator n=1 Tax=Herbiconiux oxytropis TaxID=2970915 RepID=A0AA42BTV3_9MICO|nr:MarR family transcriptional regulator [Herbiconiux oxytropis]MCS5723086.1 MarR family transcriptional regulator [Herbiconiux oxytropis]MCS5726845.1 MarR family transcriptional regulator [Herbiconiux oxytropis]
MNAAEKVTSPHAADVLRELHAYRAAEEAMRRRTRNSMKMGENDLAALRFLLRAQGQGRVVTPGMLADHLGMKSASVTVMLDRLTKSGHLTRGAHPTDRRSIAVSATSGSDDEVRATLGEMHRRMLGVASHLDQDGSEIVRRFLLDLATAADGVATA